MKTKDIVIGDDYAYAKFSKTDRIQVTVLAIEPHQREVQEPGGWHSHNVTTPMVHVRYVHGTTSKGDPLEEWILPTKIVGSWADIGPAVQAQKDLLAAVAARRTGIIAQAKAVAGVKLAAGWRDETFTLSYSDMEHLLAHFRP